MESSLPVIFVVVVGFGILIFFVNRKLNSLSKTKSDQTLYEWLKSMQGSLEYTNKTLNESLRSTNQNITTVLQTNTKHVNERLDYAAKVIADVQKNIGEMSEIGRNMKELQTFLKSPKLRGNIGEQVLKELLGQMLPKQSFHLQYMFRSGVIVDAAIKTEAGIIPIDSKFPMENFQKMMNAQTTEEKKQAEKLFISDVKKHIDSISEKYIVTNEGTIDYALMYVPSESVYYEIVNLSSLYDYSSRKRVLPVSPMTFYAYLKAILMGFEGQRISKKAHDILSGIRAIQAEYEKMGDTLDTLSRHINNSYTMMNNVQTTYTKLGQKINSTTSIGKDNENLLESIPHLPKSHITNN